jgi:hypothetical protein
MTNRAWFTFVLVSVALIAIVARSVRRVEGFGQAGDAALLDPAKVVPLMGSVVPFAIATGPTTSYVADPALPSVDVSAPGAPRAMTLFAYDRCHPSCCGASGGYSCGGGCVCVTQGQRRMLASRGSNRVSVGDGCGFSGA